MAITKVGAMVNPPGVEDYGKLMAHIEAYAKQVGNQGMLLTQWGNTSGVPAIAKGSYISHGGTLFVVDTEDLAIPEPVGDGTFYLNVAGSGASLIATWVGSLGGYTWNAIYNGLYDGSENQILPYMLVKSGGTLEKWKVTNLMQGGGFNRVDYLGRVVGPWFNQGVKTTDSPTFATINTGQGANELYRMSREVLAFGSVYDETKTEYISAMISGEVRFVNITASLTGSGTVTVRINVKLPSVGTYDVVGIGGALVAETTVYAEQTASASKTVNACILVRRI